MTHDEAMTKAADAFAQATTEQDQTRQRALIDIGNSYIGLAVEVRVASQPVF